MLVNHVQRKVRITTSYTIGNLFNHVLETLKSEDTNITRNRLDKELTGNIIYSIQDYTEKITCHISEKYIIRLLSTNCIFLLTSFLNFNYCWRGSRRAPGPYQPLI